MDELERLRTELAKAEEAVDFWRTAAIAYQDRAERAELELQVGFVDATMYEWNQAAVRLFLPCGLDD